MVKVIEESLWERIREIRTFSGGFECPEDVFLRNDRSEGRVRIRSEMLSDKLWTVDPREEGCLSSAALWQTRNAHCRIDRDDDCAMAFNHPIPEGRQRTVE